MLLECFIFVVNVFLMLLSQAPLEIILELCRDLRRDRKMTKSQPVPVANVEDSEMPVRMDSAKILVISHDISLLTAINHQCVNVWQFANLLAVSNNNTVNERLPA